MARCGPAPGLGGLGLAGRSIEMVAPRRSRLSPTTPRAVPAKVGASVAGPGARVDHSTGERGAGGPVVGALPQRQLEDSGEGSADLAVRLDVREPEPALAAHSGDELADPASRVESPGGGLRGEPLVGVIVSAEDQVGVRLVEQVPGRPHVSAVAVPAGGEGGAVPERNRAGGSRVGGQVRRQPANLPRAHPTAADVATFRVEGDHVPGADVEAVIAGAAVGRGAGLTATAVEVVEVAGGVRVTVLVVTRDWPNQRLEPSP